MTLDLGPVRTGGGRGMPPADGNLLDRAGPDRDGPAAIVPPDDAGWMSLSAAAAALGVDKSTASRDARRCPEAARRTAEGRLVAVHLPTLEAWRAATLNQAMAGNGRGRLLGAAEGAAPKAAAPVRAAGPALHPSRAAHAPEPDEDAPPFEPPPFKPEPAPVAPRGAPSYTQAKTLREAMLARRAQLDLEERQGRVIPRAEVERAAAEIGRLLKTELAAAERRTAERCGLADPAALAALLAAEHAAVLDRVRDVLARRLGTAAA